MLYCILFVIIKVFPTASKYDLINKYDLTNMLTLSIDSLKKNIYLYCHWDPQHLLSSVALYCYFVEYNSVETFPLIPVKMIMHEKNLHQAKKMPKVLFSQVLIPGNRGAFGSPLLCTSSPLCLCTFLAEYAFIFL